MSTLTQTLLEERATLTPEQRQEFDQMLGIGNPNAKTRNRLWTIVVSAFVFLFVASGAALTAGMFLPPVENAMTAPELVLSLFTACVGFLAGIFVPSPGQE